MPISVVIPACDAGKHLARCLTALHGSAQPPLEVIVVDDGSKDETRAIALASGAIVLTTERRMGPAHARNLGVQGASAEIVLFIDSDVLVAPGTLGAFAKRFEADPALDALIGSYDTEPYCWDFISQYRNLMHTFIHQTGAARAFTFWTGCGAIRTRVFREHGGFDEGYGRPAIEDIELGYRMIRSGRKIELDRTIQVKHLKCWKFWSLIKTDIFDRGIPWTALILRDRFMPNDLNLRISQRISIPLVFLLVALLAAMLVLYPTSFIFPLFSIVFWMLARWWGELRYYVKPRQAYGMLLGMLTLIGVVAYFYKMYGLILPLLFSPILLLLRHHYRKDDKILEWHRYVAIVYIFGSLAVTSFYIHLSPMLMGDLPPFSHPFITRDSVFGFGFEIDSQPPFLLWKCGKRSLLSTFP